MAEKKKKDKDNTKKRRFSLRYLIGGLLLVIFAVAVAFSPSTFLFGLAYVFVFPFGWMGMYILATIAITVGVCLTFNRHFELNHVPVIAGCVLLVLAVMPLSAHLGNGGVETFAKTGDYVNHFQTVATTSMGSELGRDPILAGGVLGYMLSGVMKDNVGEWLVYLVSIVGIVVAAVLIAMPIILYAVKFATTSLAQKKEMKQKQRERAMKEAALDEMVQEREKEMTPFIAPEDIDNSFFENKEEADNWNNPLDKFKFTPASSSPIPSSSDISRARAKPAAYPDSENMPREIKGGSVNMSTPLSPTGLQEAFFSPAEGNNTTEQKTIEAETLPSNDTLVAKETLPHKPTPSNETSAYRSEKPAPAPSFFDESSFGYNPPKLEEPFFDSPAPKEAPKPVEPAPVSKPAPSVNTVSDFFFEDLSKPAKPVEETPIPVKKEEVVAPIVEEIEPAEEIEETPFIEEEEEEPVQEEIKPVEPPKPTPVPPAFNKNRSSFLSEQPKPAPAPEPSTPAVEEAPVEEDPMVMPKVKPLAPYTAPSTDLLKVYEDTVDMAKIENTCCIRAAAIDKKFADLGLGAHVAGYTVGPSVTRFDIETDPNVSVTSITRYMKDISKAMGGVSTRFTEIVPGKTTSAIEVVNQEEDRRLIPFSTCLAGLPNGAKYNLAIPFGVDIENKVVWGDLSKFPHMLVAGTTGSGKSIFIQGILMSLVMRNRPEDVKLMLVDPKRVEFSKYRDIPHLLCRIIKEAKEARIALQKLCDEMDRRYSLFENAGVSEIREFNSDYCEPNGLEKLPFIILVVDEFADLVEQEKDVSSSVMRLSAKARACGIHLIICTQRPDVKVINGTIKNNLSTRVALHLKTATDSITILNQAGAEELMDHGDMLIDCDKISREFVRVQGCMVHNHEITAVTNHIRAQMPVSYSPIFNDFTDPNEKKNIAESVNDGSASNVNLKEDSFEVVYEYVRDEIMKMDNTSISKIQRQFRVGYPRASEIMNKLVEEGIVAAKTDAPNSSKPSEVLIHSLEELRGDAPSEKGPGSYSSSFTTPADPYDN